MMAHSPLELPSAPAANGGQFVAHWPLQTLFPEPATSLSKVYRVMPAALVIKSFEYFTGAPPMPAQAVSTRASEKTAIIGLNRVIILSSFAVSRQTPASL